MQEGCDGVNSTLQDYVGDLVWTWGLMWSQPEYTPADLANGGKGSRSRKGPLSPGRLGTCAGLGRKKISVKR